MRNKTRKLDDAPISQNEYNQSVSIAQTVYRIVQIGTSTDIRKKMIRFASLSIKRSVTLLKSTILILLLKMDNVFDTIR